MCVKRNLIDPYSRSNSCSEQTTKTQLLLNHAYEKPGCMDRPESEELIPKDRWPRAAQVVFLATMHGAPARRLPQRNRKRHLDRVRSRTCRDRPGRRRGLVTTQCYGPGLVHQAACLPGAFASRPSIIQACSTCVHLTAFYDFHFFVL